MRGNSCKKNALVFPGQSNADLHVKYFAGEHSYKLFQEEISVTWSDF